jgi:UDP-N-acetylmuramyl pentapeptide phosphotransferase/UDP-N-acetylglucosamine-1-phosphate transferase
MNQVTLALSLAGLSFMMTVIWGGPLLRVLRHFRIGKQIRVEEPGHHAVKMGTPTMGGVMFIFLCCCGLGCSMLSPHHVTGRRPGRSIPTSRHGRFPCSAMTGGIAANGGNRVCLPGQSSPGRWHWPWGLPGS